MIHLLVMPLISISATRTNAQTDLRINVKL